MLLLASTSDKIMVTTGQAVNVDVHASWVDMNGTTITPGRTNTPISTATTADVVASPAASTYRTVKVMTVRNRSLTTSVPIVIIHTDGTNAMELYRAVLAPNEQWVYVEGAIFVSDSNGNQKQVDYTNVGVPVTNSMATVVLGNGVTNNNGTANTIQDVTGLSFPVLANKMYWFEFHIAYTAAATTTGSRWSINGPVSPTYLSYASWYSLTSTTRTENNHLQAYDQPAASNATSATTGNNYARIEGIIQPSTDGTVIARFASEVLSSAIVAKAGSFARYQQIN